MDKVNISLKIDRELFEIIEEYAESRHMNRTKAITSMLSNTNVITLTEGTAILGQLYKIDAILQSSELPHEISLELRKVSDNIWQLLNLITEKIQHQQKKEITD